jgi:N-acetylglucosaminyl-diphospho-decaprenol L-rhamnosyltransferase
VTHGHRHFIEACLGSLESTLDMDGCLVALVDNKRSDGCGDFVRSTYPWVKVIARERPHSFAENNNLVYGMFGGSYFLMLNPDTTVRCGALSTLVDFMETNRSVGACGPRLVFPDGALQYSCRRFPTLWSTLLRRTPIRSLVPSDRRGSSHLMVSSPHHERMAVDWMLGACLLVRRAAISGRLLLDSRFPMYCEDIDLCYRLNEAGWGIHYVPDAVVVHHHGAESDRRLLSRASLLHTISMVRFGLKHHRLAGRERALHPGTTRRVGA